MSLLSKPTACAGAHLQTLIDSRTAEGFCAGSVCLIEARLENEFHPDAVCEVRVEKSATSPHTLGLIEDSNMVLHAPIRHLFD